MSDESFIGNLGFCKRRTIPRPEVSVLAGVRAIDDVNKVVTTSNPDLKPAISDNFSVRLARISRQWASWPSTSI
ncbi:MAG: hypothetical protein J2P21_28150 [Chloracidobacterium sp.]|nr:hypothetical protein [Chloracidobacterium sp.]